jgi:transposase
LAEYQRLIAWAKAWPDRTWAIENDDGLGHHLALWLLARGEAVLDIPTTATARVRELSRGGGRRKNDRIDAAAAASVAALQSDAHQVYPETTADSLALLYEHRVNLSHSRTRATNQLHALLRELMAGDVPASLTAASAADALRGFRTRTGPQIDPSLYDRGRRWAFVGSDQPCDQLPPRGVEHVEQGPPDARGYTRRTRQRPTGAPHLPV